MEHKNENGYTAAEERFVEKYKEVLKADDERIAEAERPVDYSFLDVEPARGRQMFWQVWGNEYTPTSWSGNL